MKGRRPAYNRYTLSPPNHISVLIHWRYQVALLKQLKTEEVACYMDFGLDFISNSENFEKPTRRDEKTLVVRSILNPKPPSSEWDEAKQEDTSGVMTLDVCGEPEEEEMAVPEDTEPDVRNVVIGSSNYTLVLRGNTLDISGGHRRTPTMEEKPPSEYQPLRTIEVLDAYDTHFHLDRSSKWLLGNLSLTMEAWTDETMERPPTVPVNLIGGTLIFCDPETFPSAVPIEDKWKVAIGVHPKKVPNLTLQQFRNFKSLITSSKVAAVGEIGLDRTVEEKYWQDQILFLETIAPVLKAVNKPVILHIRSHPQDKFGSILYFLALKLCTDNLPNQHTFVLHCFSGSTEILNAWLSQFPNTYFGFTFLVSTFKSPQIAALRAVPLNRLLVETDSPYITPPGISINSPVYIGEVLKLVAERRRQSLEDVCRQTSINAFTVFGQ